MKNVSNFYEGKNLKPCLTKQLLNMFKPWCEWGLVNVINVIKVYGGRIYVISKQIIKLFIVLRKLYQP